MFFDPKYTQLCSEKTLQANKEGFFLQFAEALAQNVGEKWIKNSFGKLKSDKERIRKIYEDDKICQHVIEFLSNVNEVYRGKCAKTAHKKRLEGEACLKNGDTRKSLTLFSQSVLKAPQKDENLSLALFGRAKALITLNEFSSALTDIQLSLKENLPTNLKSDAFWIMATCYKALNDDPKTQVSLNLAQTLIGPDVKLKPLQIHYQPIEKRANITPPITDKRHAHFKHASHKITVKSSPELGRYVVANEHIKAGDTLVVEPPTVACLLPEKFGTHCHHCFDRFVAPLGCPDCSSVAFCSATCRDAAILTYHKYECRFLDLLIGSGMSVLSLTALRSITQSSLENCLEIYKEKNSGLYGLCTNSSKRSAGDFLQRTLMAGFLLRCLQKSGYFKNASSVVPTEQEYQIGEMLLHCLQVLQFNAHEVCETLYSVEHQLKGSRPANIGVAIYPTVALFNHECYPAVSRYFVGKHIVITATRPLKPSDVIAENYGPIFTIRNLIDRQRSLTSRYWFTCQCTACQEDWPCLSNQTNVIKRVRCPTVNCGRLFSLPVATNALQCPKCLENVTLAENIDKLRWCEERYKSGAQMMEEKDTEGAIQVLCEALNVFHQVSAPPHRETHSAEEALRLCLADSGNGCDCLVKVKPNKAD